MTDPKKLLRPCRERPRGRRAANQRDELASFQLVELQMRRWRQSFPPPAFCERPIGASRVAS
jgi:hypothetical protein